MILGIGIDIADRGRFDKAIEELGDNFLDKMFTSNEKEYCNRQPDPASAYARLFALKEAAMKAMGVGLRDGILFTEIEIIEGKEIEIRLSGKAEGILNSMGEVRLHSSAAYRDIVAAAVVIIEKI
jgi:holo-[acyl-carrier protein] synthase